MMKPLPWLVVSCVFVLLSFGWGGMACDPAKSSESVGLDATEPSAEPSPEPVSRPEPPATPDLALEKVPERETPEPKPDVPSNEPYTITLFDKETVHSVGKVNVRKIVTTFRLKHKRFAKVAIFVKLESPCYPIGGPNWRNIPQGHNWPEACDAYDRNMNLTLNPPKEDGDPPGFDLIRIITPFGGPLDAAANLTDLFNGMMVDKSVDTEHTLNIGISTYSDAKGQVSGAKGSWIVSARLEITPGTPPRNVLAAIPLVNTNYKDVEGKQQVVPFKLPEGVTSTKVFYTATGHGGGKADSACIGHADEFCKRTHKIFAGDTLLRQWTPWRTDCPKFCTEIPLPTNPNRNHCKENPCGSIQSVKAPRANWCPGAITYPETITSPTWDTSGDHTFAYSITGLAAGASWKVSATLFAYGQ